jgi:hypothetical protein
VAKSQLRAACSRLSKELMKILGDLKKLVKRSLKIVTYAANFIADSSLAA